RLAVDVLDDAAVGGDEERFAEVRYRLGHVVVAVEDLQLVEADDEHQHGADDDQRAERGPRPDLADVVGVAADQHQRTRVTLSLGRKPASTRRRTKKTKGAASAVLSADQKRGANCRTRPSLPGATK